MKKFLTTLSAAAIFLVSCTAPDPIIGISDKVFSLAKTQYTAMDACLKEGEFPRTANADGTLRTSDIGWWCSGFYAGALWYIYEYTDDEDIRELAWKHTLALEDLKNRNTDHDIGFQINCSYGNALRLTGDSTAIVPTYLACAGKLAERFTPEAGVIKSWDFLRNDWRYPVIIDNMMNLELLTTASRLSGERAYAEIADAHAKTTLKNHFRPDWTSWHLVDYDPANGNVRYKETVQGYAHESAWARGQAWALYGYTVMYRETGDKAYLNAAENIGRMIIPQLPEDGIPYWDFNAPDIPDALRDASAGAIMASAFIELSTLTEDKDASGLFLETARRQLLTFGTDAYLAAPGENAGFILKHSVGNLPDDSEVDVPLSYADYYFLEALVRYSGMGHRPDPGSRSI